MQSGELRLKVWEVNVTAKFSALQKSYPGGVGGEGGSKVVVEEETGD